LHGKVTAGLYVGEIEAKPHKTIGADHLITDRKVLREHPPDILVTDLEGSGRRVVNGS